MTVFILGELYITVWAVSESGLIQHEMLQSHTDWMTKQIENTITALAEDKPTAWWDWQKVADCCGWVNNTIPDPLATGKFCTTDAATTAPGCKNVFMQAS